MAGERCRASVVHASPEAVDKSTRAHADFSAVHPARRCPASAPGWPLGTAPARRAARAYRASASRSAWACSAFKPISYSVLSSPERTVPSASLLRLDHKDQRVVRMGPATAIRSRSRRRSRNVRRSSCGGPAAARRRTPATDRRPLTRGGLGSAQRPPGVGQQPRGVVGRRLGPLRQLGADPTDGGLRLLPAGRGAQLELRGYLVRPPPAARDRSRSLVLAPCGRRPAAPGQRHTQRGR